MNPNDLIFLTAPMVITAVKLCFLALAAVLSARTIAQKAYTRPAPRSRRTT